LFHTAYTPGLSPSRGFPSLESVAPLDARSPLDVTSRFPTSLLRQAAGQMTFPAQPPSRVYPSSESVHTVPTVKFITAAVPLLSFLPSKGLSRHAIKTPSRLLLSRTFTPAQSTRRPTSPLPVPQSFSPRVARLVFEKTAVLPGVSSLVTLHTFEKSAQHWLIVSPRIPEYVTAS
jgi:hypothetical protein